MDENSLYAVFEMVASPQLVLDREGVVCAATQDYLRIVHAGREAVVGRPAASLPPYACSESARHELANALDVSVRSAVRHSISLLGTEPTPFGARFVQGSLTPVTDKDGNVTHVLHAFELESAEAGQTLSDRERRLRKMIENSFETIALVNNRGKFTFASGIERVLGYTEAEWLALPALETTHPEDAPRFGATINQVFSKAGASFLTRVRVKHKDGDYRHLEATAVNKLDDPDIASILITFRDVSEQVMMQEDVRKSEERLRIALSAARGLCWDLDLVQDLHTYSQDYAEYYGLPAGAYHGHDSMAAVHPEDRQRVLDASSLARGEVGVFSAEFRGLPRADGTVRWYASHGQVYRDPDGRPVRMLGMTWDISERRWLQEEQRRLEERLQQGQKLESLGVLAGGIAHDFNNLLMAVLGNASLLETLYAPGPEAQRCLDQIEEATRRASDLCRQLLAYAGKGQFVLASVDLNELIAGTTHLLQVSISKKIELRFDLAPSLPRIRADLTQLRQVLMNLVINAADAIGDRSGVIAVHTGVVRADRAYLEQALLTAELAPGEFVYVDISDTGAGMSEDTLSHIFEPFFTTKFSGRGLGLAAVLGIVRGHHGALRVHSVLGEGSSFRLLLPVTSVPRITQPDSEQQHEPFVGTGAVLLVDDEDTVRAVGSRMLESLGFSVLTACDGREALAVYEQHEPELACIVMDMTMPHLSGAEAIVELRRRRPDLRVLLISGYNQQEALERAAREGPTVFLQKPFTLQELESALRDLLALPLG